MGQKPLESLRDLLVLAVLGTGPGHGYALIKELRHLTQGPFELGERSIYDTLRRLEKDGLITSSQVVAADRLRRVYQITSAGSEALVTKREEWIAFSRGVTTIIGSGPLAVTGTRPRRSEPEIVAGQIE